MNHLHNYLTPRAGEETFASNALLGIRLCCTGQHAGKLLVSGALKPVRSNHAAQFFTKESLDALRSDKLATIAKSCAMLNEPERALLAAGLQGKQLSVSRLAGLGLSVTDHPRWTCSLTGGGGLFAK